MENYNHFTIDYIKAVKKHLKIEFDTKGEAVFFPEKVCDYDFMMLSVDLTEIFKKSFSSIEIVRNRFDSKIQAGLFGMTNDFDKAIKTGFLIADRIVLIDYLYERVLKKRINKINVRHIGSIASSLVQLLPLAQKGRIVMIPNPFEWFDGSKQLINEVANKTFLTPDLMSMLNMLSITKECKLHPYTIAESDVQYHRIMDSYIDKVNVLEKPTEEYAYQGILASLLSEKLLNNVEFKIALDKPITQYYDVISTNSEFYDKYMQHIISGGEIDGDNKLEAIREKMLKNISDRNNKLPTILKNAGIVTTSIGGATIGILGAISLISAPITITGVLAGIAPSLIGLLKSKDKSEEPIINVFSNLIEV